MRHRLSERPLLQTTPPCSPDGIQEKGDMSRRKRRLTALVCVGLTRVGVEESLQLRNTGDRSAKCGILGRHRRGRPASLRVHITPVISCADRGTRPRRSNEAGKAPPGVHAPLRHKGLACSRPLRR